MPRKSSALFRAPMVTIFDPIVRPKTREKLLPRRHRLRNQQFVDPLLPATPASMLRRSQTFVDVLDLRGRKTATPIRTSMMDEYEKRVIRQKRPTIVEHVKVTPEVLRNLKRADVIQEEAVMAIDLETTDENRGNRLVDAVLRNPNLNTFQAFCNQLMGDYAWLARDLRQELIADKGNLVIDDDVMKEASMMVHKKFGTSKRISENDKKDIQDLIALKIQVSKEEWRHELNAVRQELTEQTKLANDKDKGARDIDTSIRKFIADHEKQLVARVHDMVTTSDAMQICAADGDVIGIMKMRLKYIMSRTHAVLEEREFMRDDRRKVLKMLGIKDDNVTLSNAFQSRSFTERENIARLETGEKDKVIKRQRNMMDEFEKEISAKDSKLKEKDTELEEKTKELEESKQRIAELEQELSEAKALMEQSPRKVRTATKKPNGTKK